MFRKSLWVLTAVAAIVALPLLAVTFGVPDNGAHPYVGLVVFYDQSGAPIWRCTGASISPTVFLTAAHCTESPAASAQVWFDDTVLVANGYPYTGGVTGIPHPHPDWGGSSTGANTHDIGVVVLNSPVSTPAGGFPTLPTLGALDGLATRRGLQDVSFTVVGYGLQGVKPVELSERQRRTGTSRLVNLRSALTDGYNIHLSNNPGNWSGGICFGDSGGPVFLGTTKIIVGVNSFVLNENCKGAGFAFRTDTETSLDFINSYLP